MAGFVRHRGLIAFAAGHGLADAGPALGLPDLLAAVAAIRYARPRDANNPPAVVAPLLGGVLIRIGTTSDRPGTAAVFCVLAASGA